MPFFDLFPFEDYIYICPISLITKYDKKTNSAKMYGTFSFKRENYFLFKNHENVVKVIEDNLDTPIKSINGKDPFTFIQEFAGINLINKNSTYVLKQVIYTKNSLFFPATLEELANCTVIYESGQSFTTDYLIQDISNLGNAMFYENKEDNSKFISYLSNHNNKFNSFFLKKNRKSIFGSFPFMNIDDLILKFAEGHNVKSNNIFLTPSTSKITNNNIDWKYAYRDKEDNITVFECRVDEENHVNVMKIINCGGVGDSEPSLDVAEKCANLFDKNDYRIVIILPRNGGGNPIVVYNIIFLLSPYILTRNAVRIKNDTNITQFIELYNSEDLFDEINTTNKVNGNYFKDGFVSEKYGNNIEKFSKPFGWRVNLRRIEKIKSKLKHKRIPTEIVVMTDGLAFSAASLFLKNIYKSGAGIIVGFNGNPHLHEIFDISQSPTAVLGVEEYQDVYPEIAKKTIEYKIGLSSLSCIPTYHEFQESHIPQEYDVQTPDKRTTIYNAYSDALYQEFIDEAIEVLDSYKEECNPNHTMLVLFSHECKFDNHLHGGYASGSDSKWNKSNCIPVYCDSGYYYHKISNSCIKYPIEEEDDDDDDKKYWLIIVIILCAVIILIAITVIILYYKKLLFFKPKEKIIDPNYNVNDQLLGDSE